MSAFILTPQGLKLFHGILGPAAVRFAPQHNLRVAVESSEYDSLGRSTAPGALLIHTASFRNLTFTDSFYIGTQDMGSALTMGSEVRSHWTLYKQAKAHGRSALRADSSKGLDTRLYPRNSASPRIMSSFDIVVTSGDLLKVHSISHADLFYALRGGGSGSWGIIISATFSTFPAVNATFASIALAASNNTAANYLATVHAQHIFDLDPVSSSHSLLILSKDAAFGGATVALAGYLPDTTTARSMALLGPFLRAALAVPGTSLLSQSYAYVDMNAHLFQLADDTAGGNDVSQFAGKRVTFPANCGYEQLLDSGTTNIIQVVGGGKVAEDANISSAVHPAWRTAKIHLILAKGWSDSASPAEIDVLRRKFKTRQRPILELISGPDAGAYSNEADVLEPAFQSISARTTPD
ncbi:hypothetical protein B0H17DRAFT_1201274 [Mycena rosella]|uniref:Uncharacterized protein n=1 Tax=Mycena rosella TaxID=1033263 RepID=A0AAD7DH69_MYCRO|nr:hypothetical protein B0H17DRAFT_1201274 [Mycena rosella]